MTNHHAIIISDEFKNRVQAAFKAVLESGETSRSGFPSMRQVRRAMGGGSPNHILAVLREIRNQTLLPPDELEPEEVAAVKLISPTVWTALVRHAENKQSTKMAFLQSQFEQANRDLADVQNASQDIEDDNNLLKEQLEKSRQDQERLLQFNTGLLDQLAGLKAVFDQMNQQNKQFTNDIKLLNDSLNKILESQNSGFSQFDTIKSLINDLATITNFNTKGVPSAIKEVIANISEIINTAVLQLDSSQKKSLNHLALSLSKLLKLQARKLTDTATKKPGRQ
jgi:predicted  nucleic acid-binding Zn-ribbon protein